MMSFYPSTAALAVVFSLLTAACSSVASGNADASGDSGAAQGGDYPCPKVGDRACPNDEATTASDVSECTACFAEWEALSRCAAGAPGGCGADGKKSGQVPAACATPYGDYVTCAFGTLARDAGTGG